MVYIFVFHSIFMSGLRGCLAGLVDIVSNNFYRLVFSPESLWLKRQRWWTRLFALWKPLALFTFTVPLYFHLCLAVSLQSLVSPISYCLSWVYWSGSYCLYLFMSCCMTYTEICPTCVITKDTLPIYNFRLTSRQGKDGSERRLPTWLHS